MLIFMDQYALMRVRYRNNIICFSMLLKTSKVAQKLPSTIGTGLVVEWPEVSDLRELYIPPVPFSYDFGFGFMITNIFLSLKSRNFGV